MAVIARQQQNLQPVLARSVYARMARFYDSLFGPLLGHARATAIRAVNASAGTNVLEIGVGTGLALPQYDLIKKIVGIDLSPEMLNVARRRTAELGLANVQALYEMDAQVTNFADGQFDIAAAMFVASVVPDPRILLAEMRRIVKPGGKLVLVNHFARDIGLPTWWRRLSNGLCIRLGWRSDFRMQDIFTATDLKIASIQRLPPFGLFYLVEITLPNKQS